MSSGPEIGNRKPDVVFRLPAFKSSAHGLPMNRK
jgi:hypothetical protein